MRILGRLRLVPAPDTISRAQAWLKTIGDQQQWPPRLAFSLNLCLDEALTNVLEYGFPPPPDGAISSTGHPAFILLELKADHLTLTLELVDNGRPFDPTQTEPAALASTVDEAPVGGHGLRLLRHYLQDIHYRFQDGQNHLQMIVARDAKRSDDGTT